MLARILEMVHKLEFRQNCYNDLRSKFPKDSKCAYTQSYLLRKVGILQALIANTLDLSNKLGSIKWTKVSMAELQEGDTCFTEDNNNDKRKAPDHTFMFIHWFDKKNMLALIWDNNNVNFTVRNLGEPITVNHVRYAKTPFAYALRCPVDPEDDPKQ